MNDSDDIALMRMLILVVAVRKSLAATIMKITFSLVIQSNKIIIYEVCAEGALPGHALKLKMLRMHWNSYVCKKNKNIENSN